jgi:hypothetical protein
MSNIQVGDKLKVIFTQPLSKKEYAPDLKQDEEKICIAVHIDSGGNRHIDVGLPLKIEFVKSFATGEVLPGKVHWCHPNRFVII